MDHALAGGGGGAGGRWIVVLFEVGHAAEVTCPGDGGDDPGAGLAIRPGGSGGGGGGFAGTGFHDFAGDFELGGDGSRAGQFRLG